MVPEQDSGIRGDYRTHTHTHMPDAMWPNAVLHAQPNIPFVQKREPQMTRIGCMAGAL